MKLSERYHSLKSSYIKAFEKQTELEFEHESGEILFFGDYCFNFDTIRQVVDNSIKFKTLSQWHWFTVEYKCKINLVSYWKREIDVKENIPYSDYKDYQLMLLNEMIP